MNTEMREYRLEVSEYFFKLSAMCQRIYGERTRREPSLSNVIHYRIRSAHRVLDSNASTLLQHLEAIPTMGDVAIDFAIPPATDDLLEKARLRYSAVLESDLTVGDAVSLLLFDYVVEDKADAVIAMLGIETLQ